MVNKRARVLIVDNHPAVCEGLSANISRQNDLEVCALAPGVKEALRATRQTSPDVAVVALTLKNSNGIELIGLLRGQFPQVRILVYTSCDEWSYGDRAFSAGAHGYVTKELGSEAVVDAIRQVLSNQIVASESLIRRMFHRKLSQSSDESSDPVDRLSRRELEIFRLLGAGFSTREIALQLKSSPHTVDSHRANIKKKLNIDTAIQLYQRAKEWCLEHS